MEKKKKNNWALGMLKGRVVAVFFKVFFIWKCIKIIFVYF
jgi:hypothetical protein